MLSHHALHRLHRQDQIAEDIKSLTGERKEKAEKILKDMIESHKELLQLEQLYFEAMGEFPDETR